MRVKVEFEVEIPDGMSEDTITEWLRWEFRDNGQIKTSNPLANKVAEPVPYTFEWREI